MRIIDNKKDYYDYLSGIYGIDEHVVFDRRGSLPLKWIMTERHIYWEEVFNPNILRDNGQPVVSHYTGYTGKKKYKTYNITVEVGDKHWYILCNRTWEDKTVYNKDDKAELTFEFYDPDKNTNSLMAHSRWWLQKLERDKARRAAKFSDSPIAVKIDDVHIYRDKGDIVNNPILGDFPFIKKLIPAEEIWNSVYDYLLKQKEPKIIDNRTDIEHLESAGFDKKTSFRNM